MAAERPFAGAAAISSPRRSWHRRAWYRPCTLWSIARRARDTLKGDSAMPTLKECLALVLIALLSVLSVASPVAADHHREKAEPVNVMNKAANPVPVSVQGTVPVTIVGGAPVGTGGGRAPAPEEGPQFTRQGPPFAVFNARAPRRTGQRFVRDRLPSDAPAP